LLGSSPKELENEAFDFLTLNARNLGKRWRIAPPCGAELLNIMNAAIKVRGNEAAFIAIRTPDMQRTLAALLIASLASIMAQPPPSGPLDGSFPHAYPGIPNNKNDFRDSKAWQKCEFIIKYTDMLKNHVCVT